MPEILLTVDQAAERLQVHPTSVRRQLQSGRLRGIKRGKLWRVPESALMESTPLALQPNGARRSASNEAADPRDARTHGNGSAPDARALLDGLRSGDPSARNAAIIALTRADAKTRAQVQEAVAQAVEAHPLDEDDLADWRALDGEPFHDEAGDYYTDEEEAQFRAERAARRASNGEARP